MEKEPRTISDSPRYQYYRLSRHLTPRPDLADSSRDDELMRDRKMNHYRCVRMRTHDRNDALLLDHWESHHYL